MKKVLLITILCSLATGCHYAAKMHGVTGSVYAESKSES